MELDRSFVEGIIRRHCPCFYLVTEDPYAHPSSFKWFVEHSSAVDSSTGTLLLSDVNLSSLRELIDSLDHARSRTTVKLELSSTSAHLGERVTPINEVPVYCSVKAVCRPCGEFEAIELSFVTKFAFNGPYFFGLFGSHTGDIEHITVRTDRDGQLLAVWYNSHRNCDGLWVAAKDVEIDSKTGRIVSFVARSGHGHYPSEGIRYRHFGFANDHMRRETRWCPARVVWIEPVVHTVLSRGVNHELEGKHWVCVQPSDLPELFVDEDHRIIGHARITGWGEAAGLVHQKWWRESAEPSRSRPWYCRFFSFLHWWDCDHTN